MAAGELGSFFDDDGDERTVVDLELDAKPSIPNYPTLAVYGPFEILGRVARGGMAEVYLAREPSPTGTPRHVVLKRILPEREDDAEFIAMFREEATLARRLYHPNVCHVYETGEIEGRTFMTLEWVHGVSLRDLLRRALRRGKRVPPRLACHIGAKVAAALDYVHRATGVDGKPLEIIHRDVSPHNVMVGWDGRVKLLDFGIAKTSSQEDPDGGVLKGKHAYLAPEQARSRPVDPRTDVFALGIVLHELLTGKPLYHRNGLLPTLEAILEEPAPPTRQVHPDIPAAADAVVLRALEKPPERRFQTAGDMRAALERVVDATGGAVTPAEVAAFLDGVFGPDERAPLAESNQKLTGSFMALTDAHSASYGPFSDQPRQRVASFAPPPSVAPPPELSLPSLAPMAPPIAETPRDWTRVWVVVGLVLLGMTLFGLAFTVAYLLVG